MSNTINALRPTQNPATRFAGQPGTPLGLTGPQMPARALRVPLPGPAAVNAPVAVQPQPGPIAPGIQPTAPSVAPPPVPIAPSTPPVPAAPAPPAADTAGRISSRVPVPAADFHPSQHADLHKAMGSTFDKADASKFIREAYDAVREIHPHIAPRAALLTARDAWHAVQHGFMPHQEAAHHALRTYPALFANPSAGGASS